MLAASRRTAEARPTMTRARPLSTVHITFLRSTRSTTTPLTKLNSSHGRRPAKVTAATAAGSLVTLAASSGSAASRTPSPRVEIPAAVHSRR